MKNAVELFTELGDRLRNFGNDAQSRVIVERACAWNAWFTPAEVRRAVEAISCEMLRRDRLGAWLAHYPVPVRTPLNILIVMAGNIPLVGFFDLLCVVASGHRCLVKPAARDRVLLEYIVDLLREIEPGVAVTFCEELVDADAVIATGSDNANRYFRARYAGVPTLLRGSRRSVAVLSGCETEAQLKGLADDVWAYSGLGCRNVSLVFVPREVKVKLEMVDVNNKYTNNYIQNRALCVMTNRPFSDLRHAIFTEYPTVGDADFPLALSEIAVVRYQTLAEVAAWLSEHEVDLQCVVTDCLPHGRRVGFGRAQSPALTDYPDARDVMAFLTQLER